MACISYLWAWHVPGVLVADDTLGITPSLDLHNPESIGIAAILVATIERQTGVLQLVLVSLPILPIHDVDVPRPILEGCEGPIAGMVIDRCLDITALLEHKVAHVVADVDRLAGAHDGPGPGVRPGRGNHRQAGNGPVSGAGLLGVVRCAAMVVVSSVA